MRDWRQDIRERIVDAKLDPSSESEVVEELAQHLEDQFTEMRHRGVSEESANATLLAQLDAPGFAKGVLRGRRAPVPPPSIGGPSNVGGWFASAVQDLRYGARSLRRSPAFTVVAVLSLGLAIGANTAIFGLVNAVLLERMPVVHPERLVSVQWTSGNKKLFDHMCATACALPALTYAEYVALTKATGLPALGAASGNSVTVVANSAREFANVDAVTGGYFEVVGVRPLLGRTISRDDDANAAPITVISEDFWHAHYESSPAVLGQVMTMNDQRFTIVGVLPRAFHGTQFGGSFALAIPLGSAPLIGIPTSEAQNLSVTVVGRLAPGMTREAASAATNVAHRQCCASSVLGQSMRGPGATQSANADLVLVDASRGIAGMKVDIRAQYRRMLIILMAGVAVVLLIACANVGNLLLARAAARQRELAVRMSMGATRSRIVRQLLTESFELAIAGAVLGLVVARLGTSILSQNLPSLAASLADRIALTFSPVILGFTAAVTIGCTLLFGVLPAARATRADIMSPLRDGAKGSRGRSRWPLDRGLVVAQIALALVLISAATLFVATLRNLREFDGGYGSSRVLLGYVDTRDTPFASRGMEVLYQDMLERVSHIPGVQRVALGTTLPVFGGRRTRVNIRVPGYEPRVDEDMASWVNGVTPGYFAATGIGLRAGREFDSHDLEGSEPVVIVSHAFAERFFPGRDPVGTSFSERHRNNEPGIQMRIVGVANDARYDDLRAPPTELYYMPLPQYGNAPFLNFVIATSGDPVAAASTFAREIDAIAPGIRIRRLAGLEQVLDEALARERLSAGLATLFGVFALVLAAVGLYGVVAYNVSRRTSEIGIRMALGARPLDAVWLVVRQTLTMTLVGVAIGVPLSLAAARSIGAQLYGIGAADPLVMTGAAAVLAMAGVAATIVPGRRAARIDPVEALRAD